MALSFTSPLGKNTIFSASLCLVQWHPRDEPVTRKRMAQAQATQGDSAAQGKLRQGFVALVETLLASISDVFPECKHTLEALEFFQAFVKGKSAIEEQFIRLCRDLFDQHREGLASRKEETLFQIASGIQVLSAIDLKGKWSDPEFTQESKDNLWKFIVSLDSYSQLYCSVPDGLKDKIEALASGIKQQAGEGTLNLGSLDIAGLGRTLIGELGEKEMQMFEGNVDKIYESLGNLAATISRSQGSSSPLDMSALVNHLTKLQAGGLDADAMIKELGLAISPKLVEELPQIMRSFARTLCEAPGAEAARDVLCDAQASKRQRR